MVYHFSSDVTFRCQSLELESHDCLNDLVENISRGPVTRTVLRLQSLGTDYGSDDLGVESSEEAVGAQLKEVTPPSNVKLHYILFVVIIKHISFWSIYSWYYPMYPN